MRASQLPPNAKLAVRFLSRWQVYYRGDVATFPARMAASLVANGRAERVNIAPLDAEVPEGAEPAIRMPQPPPLRQRQPDEDDFIL